MPANRQGFTPNPSRVGELLLQGGFISRRELHQALLQAERQGLPLCQILMRQRRINRLEKTALLSLQQRLRDASGETSTSALHCRLGDLMLADGHLTREELDRALEQQQKTKMPLGTILLKAGQTSVEKLTGYLRLQQKLLSAATAVLLACAAATPCHASDKFSKTAAWGSIDAEKTHTSPHSLSANWRRPGLLESASPLRYSKDDEILRSRNGKMVLRLTETGVEFRKFF